MPCDFLFTPLGLVVAWLLRTVVNFRSKASDPGRIRLSHAKLRRLEPYLYPSLTHPWWLLRWLLGPSMAQVYWIRDVLIHGDSRAAVVMSVRPLLVAAYTDELDTIALLQFPDEFA